MLAARRSNDAVTKEILELMKHGSESNNSAKDRRRSKEMMRGVLVVTVTVIRVV
jgi:hypothetical protein